MAVYADHPYKFIATPSYLLSQDPDGGEPNIFYELASDMALVHTSIARYLNSIYLQAPHITPADEKDFCRYILTWHESVHVHHSNEEAYFFPAIEAMAGESGIMEANLAQHHTFEPGVAAFQTYVEEVLAGREKYDGAKVVDMIETFGELLITHLTNEIPTLLALDRFGVEKMKDVLKITADEAAKGMVVLSLSGRPRAALN